MTERLNSAITALMTDDSLLSRFQRSPEAAMRRFGLSECELDAVKSGDEQQLLAHGLKPELINRRPEAPHWFGGLLGTVARRVAAPVVIAVLVAFAVQGGGISTASAARANRNAARHVSRMRTGGPVGLRTLSRTRARRQTRWVRASVRDGARYSVGLDTALAQIRCDKCSPDGTAK